MGFVHLVSMLALMGLVHMVAGDGWIAQGRGAIGFLFLAQNYAYGCLILQTWFTPAKPMKCK